MNFDIRIVVLLFLTFLIWSLPHSVKASNDAEQLRRAVRALESIADSQREIARRNCK